MKSLSRSLPFLPLLLGGLSLALFVPGIAVMERSRAWLPTLQVAIPAVGLAILSMAIAAAVFRKKPSGSVYGLTMTGNLTGGFSLIFWVVMVPMMLIFAIPARDADPVEPVVEQSRDQMRIWVRHIKTFYRDEGRMPVKLEELVDKGYAQDYLLYDPRQSSKDAPSYRLMLREMPPESDWATLPVLEGRIPHPRDGTRLVAYLDESVGVISP